MPDELTFPSHPSEELLERFAMGKLAENEVAWVEEHLLFCTRCQEGVEEIDAFIRATRKAAAELPPLVSKPKQRWSSVFALPIPAAGVAIAALVLTVTMLSWRPFQTVQTVDLTATRGTSAGTAKSDAPVRLNLAVADLSAGATFTVELVDSTGVPKWDQRDISPVGSRLTANVPKSLRPGQYFVRVYSNSLKNELLTEYSLLVQ